jgi:hypothetical protein
VIPLIVLLFLTLYHPDFDLDEIPDDRDLGEINSIALTPPANKMPTPQTDVQKSSKRKRRKRTRKSSVDNSSDAPNAAPHEEVQPLRQSVPKNPQLIELEPETFHIYASSDGSDSGEPLVSQKARKSIEDEKQEESEPDTSDITDNSSPEDQAEPTTPIPPPEAADLKRSARSKLQSPEKDVHKNSSGHASNLGLQISSGFTAVNHNPPPEAEPQANPAPNPPSLINGDGHWSCPFADAYSCTKSFSSQRAARRHAGSHLITYTCSVCKKSLTRPDTLKRHMERHTALEISVAEAGKEAETLQVAADDDNDSEGEQDEMKDDSPVAYTTPMETSQFEPAEEEYQIDVDEEQARADEDPEANPARQLVPERPSTPPDLEDAPFDILIKETPTARQGQKRKREIQKSGSIENASSGPRKRLKEIDVSSSTLVPSSTDPATNIQAQQVTEKIVPQLQPRRQSSIEGWAQAYKPGSNLRHPTLNPTPSSKRTEQLLEVVVPRTSQASTSLKDSNKGSVHKKVIQNRTKQDGNSENSNAKLNFPTTQKSAYTTTNGKGRAAPGVEYSSPSKTDSRRGSGRKSSGIATSVAKRTFPKASADGVNGDSASEYGGDTAANSDDEVSATEITLRNIGNESFECGTCHMKFSSGKALKRHLKKPNVHTYLLKCQTCAEKFVSTSALARHETESGHGKGDGLQGQVGAFNDYEVQKLNNWKDTFCEEHNITGAQFNDMMTDTLHRGREGTWNWAFIKRTDFLAEYLNVLPKRNKRSMLRYRERNFQNVEGSLNWTEEDDRELIRLQKEMGTKWSKIAKILMRTQDAVSQRWRHKLQYTQLESGEWSRAENTALTTAMEELRRQSGVAADAQDWNIPWVQISEKVKTRTPQQCSNHWRALHHLKVDGKWVPVSGLEKTPGASRILTPSKMQKRLAGAVPRSAKRTALSSEYVEDDDTDEENVSGMQKNSGKGKAPQSKPTGIESESETSGDETRETPHINRNQLTKRTPGKTLGSSQLFAQTQANTSALKPPPSNPRRSSQAQSESESQERPSPNVPIQRRAVSRSPLQEINPLQHVELDMAENDDVGDMESEDDAREDVEIQESEIERSDAEDEVMADESEIESSDAEDKAMADESEIEDESASEHLGSGANERNETDRLLEDEAEETSEEDSGEEDSDNDDSEDESDGDEQQSSVDDENNDFMDSINESAQRVKSSQVRSSNGKLSGLRKTHKSRKDESEDEETESE